MALQLKLEDKPWYYALGWGLGIGIILAGAVHYALVPGPERADQDQTRGPRVASPGDSEGSRGRAQAASVPRGGPPSRARALEAPAGPPVEAQHRGADQADRDTHAAGRLHAEEVHSGRVRGEGVLFGVADRHPARRHVPQPRPLLRPDEPLLPDHQRRGPEGHASSTTSRRSRSRAVFVAKTFIYTGEEQAAPVEGQPGAAPAAAPPPAAASAQKLKERAEGRGAD